MARKKLRVPSPSPPPPTPPREEPSSEEEEEEEEEEAEATPATQKPPQNPNHQSSDAADADSSDGGEEESSDSETDANAFQLRQLAPSTGKPSQSDAADEDGSSSESPEPIQSQKKAPRKSKAEAGKKRQAADPSPSGGKAKKAKADVGKAAAPSELNASSKGGKKKREKAVQADRSPSKPAVRRWTIEDEIKVLEALVSHVKANGTQPSAGELIAAVGDTLERKDCSKTEMYEKVRYLRLRHEKAASTGTRPGNEDDLRKFNLSEAVWGESAKEVAALTISQNDGASSKSSKGKINKEKAKEAATTDTPVKSKKKRGNHKEELQDDAKAEQTTNTATQNGATLVRSKSGKTDKEKTNGDAESLRPKEAVAVTQNGDTLFKNGETREQKMDTDPNVENMRKGFDELQNLYPNLSSYVESIHAQHPCGETLKRAFQIIADDKACALEAKIKKQRVAEMKMATRRADTKKEVTNLIIGLLD